MGSVNVVDLLPGERTALLGLLIQLTDKDWSEATVCAGWSVKDVALHLLGDDVGLLSRGRDGFTAPWFEGLGEGPVGWTQLIGLIDEQNASWVGAARRLSPRLLGELLHFTGEATFEYFRGLDFEAMAGPVAWMGREPAPIWLHVAREYTERWVHQQQIRDAVGRPGLTERRWLGPVLHAFARALPRSLREAEAEVGTWVRLVVTGGAGGVWTAVRRRRTGRVDGDDGPGPGMAVVHAGSGTGGSENQGRGCRGSFFGGTGADHGSDHRVSDGHPHSSKGGRGDG